MPIRFHDYQINLIPFGNYLYYRDLQLLNDVSSILDEALNIQTEDSLILCSFLQPNNVCDPNVIETNKYLNIPIYLGSYSGHEAIVNQAFLDKSEIKLTLGFTQLTGHWVKVKLIGSNSLVYKSAWSLQSASQRQQFAETACKYLISIGCVGFDTFDGWGLDPEIDWEIIQRCSKIFPLEIRLLAQGLSLDNMKSLVKFKDIAYGSCEYWIDGSIGAETAALSEPYNSGIQISPLMSHSEVTLALEFSFKLNVVPCLHIIGDVALDIVLDCLASQKLSNKLVRLCHLCVVREDQLERLQEFSNNLELIINPGFYKFWHSNLKKLSPTLHGAMLPYSKLIARFDRVYYGSDAPVTLPNAQLAQELLFKYQSGNLSNLIDYQLIFRSPNEKPK